MKQGGREREREREIERVKERFGCGGCVVDTRAEDVEIPSRLSVEGR